MSRAKTPAKVVAAFAQERQQALFHLRLAHEAAEAQQRHPAQFACQLPHLLSQGVTDTALRWLVDARYADHLMETTVKREQTRTFTEARGLRLLARSCFVLTPSGVEVARRFMPRSPHDIPVPQAPDGVNGLMPPRWDSAHRILWVDNRIVKRFRVPAQNQELILSAFEEERWPAHLDDPLPPESGLDPKRCLHDTIKGLNRNQSHRALHFEGDGTGRGLCWCRFPRPPVARRRSVLPGP
jgi:hypothetical protein